MKNTEQQSNLNPVLKPLNTPGVCTNGCSGKCCETFAFPYTLAELQEVLKAKKEGFVTWIDRKGKTRNVPPEDENIEFIADMLIFKEYSNQTGWGCSIKEFAELMNGPDIVLQDGQFNNSDLKNGELYANLYTCRHFNLEKRICTAYEQRPPMCIRFGHSCHYDCNYMQVNGFEKHLTFAEKKAMEEAFVKNNSNDQILDELK